MNTFENFDLSEDLKIALKQSNFLTPTPIQERAIPLALSGKDLIGIAQTGTGKTAAFLLPTLTQIVKGEKKQALILTPTRELAFQIADVFSDFTAKMKQLRAAILIGGASMGKQIRALSQNPAIIIATPGRLNDHLRRKTFSLKGPGVLIQDEMDRMLDMGFLPQIKEILPHLPKERQNLLFSATFPESIRKLVKNITAHAETLQIDSVQKPAEKIVQNHVELEGPTKNDHLLRRLKGDHGPILVFTRTNIRADILSRFLKQGGIRTTAIHGDRTQAQRKDAIFGFMDGKYSVLVATDIASRGLDIPNIKLVVNFDLPESREDYIHRIGRTARAGTEGEALSLVTPEERGHWRMLSNQASSGGEGSYRARKKPNFRRRPRSKGSYHLQGSSPYQKERRAR